jgi:hypothetical protein
MKGKNLGTAVAVLNGVIRLNSKPNGFGLTDLMLSLLVSSFLMVGAYKFVTGSSRQSTKVLAEMRRSTSFQMAVQRLALDFRMSGSNPRILGTGADPEVENLIFRDSDASGSYPYGIHPPLVSSPDLFTLYSFRPVTGSSTWGENAGDRITYQFEDMDGDGERNDLFRVIHFSSDGGTTWNPSLERREPLASSITFFTARFFNSAGDFIGERKKPPNANTLVNDVSQVHTDVEHFLSRPAAISSVEFTVEYEDSKTRRTQQYHRRIRKWVKQNASST